MHTRRSAFCPEKHCLTYMHGGGAFFLFYFPASHSHKAFPQTSSSPATQSELEETLTDALQRSFYESASFNANDMLF